jgi:hypothetical protein
MLFALLFLALPNGPWSQPLFYGGFLGIVATIGDLVVTSRKARREAIGRQEAAARKHRQGL